jgi:undecaprenyl-diphosphatase
VSRAAFLGAAVAFLALASGVALTGPLPGDAGLRDLILAHASPPLTAVMHWINLAGNWRVLVPAAPLLLLFPRTRRHWWIWLLVLIVAPSLESLLKPLIGRPRPESPAFGFPSGHATAAAAYLAALAWGAGDLRPLARRALRALAAVLILLVGLARVVLRAHWPSDALGGIALGLACAGAAVLISSSIDRSRAGPASPAPPSRAAPSRTPPAPG